jgi:ElaB/YqjD/DUF883 family membrane-anchored ribosome-binding protein
MGKKGHHLDRLLDDIKTIVFDGQELLKAGADQARRRAVLGAQVTDRSVRDHPYHSIGIVLGLGVLIGVLASSLIGRRRHEHEEAPAHG